MQIIRKKGDVLFLSYHGENGFYFPYSNSDNIDARMIKASKQGPFDNWLLKKYTKGKAAILETDTVIDCGAFVGAFSIAAFKKGVKRVYSIEPSSSNFKCVNLNIDHYKARDIIHPYNIGLGNTNGYLDLNISTHGCEHSFLKCDKGSTNKTEKVEVQTLERFINDHNIDSSKLYLKIEAEGFEPEIVTGLKDCQPRVIAVDVTPERNGKSPKAQIETMLKSKYTIQHSSRCLFAVKKGQ